MLSWAGKRGIVTLAAAFAIPETLPDGTPFPHRDLFLVCAFAVVLVTLVLQVLTMAPLIRTNPACTYITRRAARAWISR